MLRTKATFLQNPLAVVPGDRFVLYGGAVRDQLLGLKPTDYDYVYIAQGLPEFSFKTMQSKLEANDWSPVTENSSHFSFKARHSATGAVADFSWHKGDLASWLVTRDITINALTADSTGEVSSFRGVGATDLEKGLINTCLAAPLETIAADPIRALRILRFSLRFGFKLAPKVRKAYDLQPEKIAYLLSSEAPERRRQESVKLLQSACPFKVLQLLSSLDPCLQQAVLKPNGRELKLTLS
jgi:tRNA nucleotidyltransferase (CCA-adding enzyme)